MISSFFRELRAWWRITLVGWMILSGIATVRFRLPGTDTARQRAIKQAWAGRLLRVLGVKLDAAACELPTSTLIVCNHISWLDIFVLHALTPATFVCKDDVKKWPALGWLVENTGTLFIERGSRSGAARAAQAMAGRLRADERVAVFPEGTTTQGSFMLPFRAALFQAAVDAQVPVQAISLRYCSADGQRSLAPAYDGDISFAQCLLAIARSTELCAELHFLAPIAPSRSRRDLARQSEQAIAADLGFSLALDAQVLDEDLPPEAETTPASEARAA